MVHHLININMGEQRVKVDAPVCKTGTLRVRVGAIPSSPTILGAFSKYTKLSCDQLKGRAFDLKFKMQPVRIRHYTNLTVRLVLLLQSNWQRHMTQDHSSVSSNLTESTKIFKCHYDIHEICDETKYEKPCVWYRLNTQYVGISLAVKHQIVALGLLVRLQYLNPLCRGSPTGRGD